MNNSISKQKNNRLTELDALRGLAAVCVVMYHYTQRFNELYPNYMSVEFKFSYGNLGVQLFFIISGFVIFLTIKQTTTSVEFIKKRAIRLYPAYITCVIITFLCVSIFGLEGRETSFKDALINLSLLEGFIPGTNYVDGAYWSLTVEITFYILISILIYFRSVKYIYQILCVWLFSSTILYFIVEKTNLKILGILYERAIFNYAYLFIAGISFYFLMQKKSYKYILLLFSTLLFQFLTSDIVTFTIVLILYFVFWLAITKKISLLSRKPLLFMGNISYGLYLIHQNIGYIIILKMNDLGFNNQYYLIIPLIISIILAYIITKYLEKPMMKFLYKKYISNNNIKKAS